MAPGTEVSPLIIPLENGHIKESVSAIEADVDSGETTDNLSQLHAGKPPRTTAGMRHCLSATRLANLAELEAILTRDQSHSWRMSMFVLTIFGSTLVQLEVSPYLEHFMGNMLIANAGDSRAVLGKRGRAVELSKDHKPSCTSERTRIEKMGGVVYDGYLNGQLSVARALGDWHLKGPKGSSYPLSCEPELHEIVLTDEDEFLIIGCDGLWDVMSSQCAVTMVRKELTQHNDPERCSKELVKEALSRNSSDNLTVVVICFSLDPPPRIEIPRSQKRRSISAEGLDLLKGVLNGV